MATEKQVRYLMSLLERAGYGIQYMGAEHKALGAKMSERRGSVESWLHSLSDFRASTLIDRLKEESS